MSITSEQVRAARALLRWEQRDLAEAAQISLPSVKRLEGQGGTLSPALKSVVAIKGALENKGVCLTTNYDEYIVSLNLEKNLQSEVFSCRSQLFPDVTEWSQPISDKLNRPDLVGFDRDRKPIIVEVKYILDNNDKFNQVLIQIEHYAVQYGSKTAILVAKSIPDTLPKMTHLKILRRHTRSLRSTVLQLLEFSSQ